MKKSVFILVLLAICSFAFAQLQTTPQWTRVLSDQPETFRTHLISSSENSIKVNVQVPGFYMTNVTTTRGEAKIISMPKTVSTAKAGEPDVPMTGIPTIIGDQARMNIRVLDAQYMDFDGIEIAPSKGDFPRTIDPATVPYTYGECYSQDAFFPANNVDLYEPYIVRDFRGQNMVVYPYAYNPVTKTLRVYYNMTVEMYKVDDNGSNVMETRRSNTIKMDPDFKNMYQRHFINYEAAMNRYTPLDEEGDLLIICYDDFMSSMTNFVNWKKTRGINTTIVGTSTAGSTYSAIKTYIQNQYNANNNLTHVLLVGDVAQIPGYSYSGGGSSYSGKGDNAYGQIVGSDIYNDVFIGRFSASTAARVTTQCNRVITYERDLTTSATWLKIGEGISRKENSSGHNNEDDYQHIENIRTNLLNYGYSPVYQRYANLTGYTATASQISSDINSGVGIINYCNHGQETAWGANYSGYVYYANSHVNALTNENKLPFIWSIACLVGKYDHSTDCFAEAWMNATNNNNPTGAIGTLMSYIEQPWIPPMWAQDECVDILVESYSSNIKHTWGGTSINGLMSIFDHYSTSNQSAVGTYQAWILYGDPSLMLRTKIPTAMNITHAGTIDLSATSYSVSVSNGDGALVTITDANYNILGRAMVSNGTANVNISGTLTPNSELTLCVFGYNKVTYLGTISVNGDIQYTVDVTSSPTEGGTVSGAGTYLQGENCTLTAMPNAGYTFSNWTENGVVVSTENPYAFTVSGNRDLVANFVEEDNNNLVFNGDFELGNVGFETDYLYLPNMGQYGSYTVDTAGYNQLYGFGGIGMFMIVDGSTSANAAVWRETVEVNPNTLYDFSIQIVSIGNSANFTQARLQFLVNGVQIGDVFYASSILGLWQEFQANWNSGDATTAVLTIIDLNTSGDGNDFGLDDIYFGVPTEPSDDHEYVDLGLPSGTLWATCNVGAEMPEDYGDYFAWGETQPKDYYDWSTYQYCMGSNTTLTKYCSDSNYGYNGFTDNLTILLPEDDAATANWGNGWRMPTEEEWQELNDNTTVTWTTQNGVNGRLFTASNGNSLFLPAAGIRSKSGFYHNAGTYGNYWSSSLRTDRPFGALHFTFISDNYNIIHADRQFGVPVRPVRAGSQNTSFIIDATANPAEGGEVSGGGAYPEGTECTLTATANPGYTFVNWTENEIQVSDTPNYSFTVTSNRTLIANFIENQGTITQTSTFSQGYNWWSTYIEQEGINGLGILQEGLGDNGVTIRSQASGYTDYYQGYGWYGSLSSLNNESSYRVITSAPCTVTMTGSTAVPSQHPITLSQGWTWIGYVPSTAMSVDAAMANVNATSGDKLKSQQGYADYYAGYGWFGSLNTIEQGMGLMYYSANSATTTFTYPDSGRGGELKRNITAENNHWVPNIYAYPDNMTVMAVVELDDTELASDNYELAAFAANGECRGSVKLTYAEPLHRYVAFLTISGKDAAELSFRLYDTETNVEYYDAEESLDFVADAIVGEATDLYTIHFRGTTGMDEFASKVRVYPNPVNAGERFSIGMTNVETYPVLVEIVNALGVETLRATSLQTPASIVAPTTAGVYTLRITVEGKGTAVRKLVVK